METSQAGCFRGNLKNYALKKLITVVKKERTHFENSFLVVYYFFTSVKKSLINSFSFNNNLQKFKWKEKGILFLATQFLWRKEFVRHDIAIFLMFWWLPRLMTYQKWWFWKAGSFWVRNAQNLIYFGHVSGLCHTCKRRRKGNLCYQKLFFSGLSSFFFHQIVNIFFSHTTTYVF